MNNEYEFPVFFFLIGAIFGLCEDLCDGNGRKHVFYATRFSYYLMFVYFILRWVGFSTMGDAMDPSGGPSATWMGTYLLAAAPTSVVVFVMFNLYAVFGKFNVTTGSSFMAHEMMPYFAMMELAGDEAPVPWYSILFPIALGGLNVGMQWVYSATIGKKYRDDLYPECHLRSMRMIMTVSASALVGVCVVFIHWLFYFEQWTPAPEWIRYLIMAVVFAASATTVILHMLRHRAANGNRNGGGSYMPPGEGDMDLDMLQDESTTFQIGQVGSERVEGLME